MPSLFLLLALLSSAGLAQGMENTEYRVPKGKIPDGTLITFYFYHTGKSNSHKSKVRINFVAPGGNYAHIRIDHDSLDKPIATSTNIGDKWVKDSYMDDAQTLDEMAKSPGWWRVDVHKFDATTANVCFQGFWSKVRTFKISLTEIQKIIIQSDSVDHSKMLIVMNLRNDNLPLVDSTQWKLIHETWKSSRQIPIKPIAFPAFPVGAHIEMAVWFPAFKSNESPSISFTRHVEDDKILSIRKRLSGKRFDTNELVLETQDGKKVICIAGKGKKTSNLQHFYLYRVTTNKLRVRVLYKDGIAGVPCEVSVEEPYITGLDSQVRMIWRQGAFPLIMSHSIPMGNDAKDS